MRLQRNRLEQLGLFSQKAPPIYFASGTNHAGEIKGFAEQGQPMGAAADECRGGCVTALKRLAGSGIPVFLDSGAFSEVKEKKKDGQFAGFKVDKLITDADWRERLALYAELADALGPQLYVVAPDRVGDQKVTLARLRKYAPQVRDLISTGANVMVPLQRGAMPLSEFDQRVQDALGTDAYVVAFPMKKGATAPESIAEFLAYRKPRRIHLLGLGAKNKNAPKILELIEDLSPSTQVSLDSNKLKAAVGWLHDEYQKRMKKAGLTPMSKEEWVPQSHLRLPGFRMAPKDAPLPRRFTQARSLVMPVRPYWSRDLAVRHQKELGLEEDFGMEVLDDRQMVDRVDEWLPRKLRKEATRQSELNLAWDDYREGLGPRPPEAPWLPNAWAWPAESRLAKGFRDGWSKEDAEWLHKAAKTFMRSPHEYIAKWGPGEMTLALPAEGSREHYSVWADALRPLYLEALGRMPLPEGGMVKTAYVKRKAIEAAFGSGEPARRFERQREATRALASPEEHQALLAVRFFESEGQLPSMWHAVPEEEHAALAATAVPQFDEARLLRWTTLPAPDRLEALRLRELREAGEITAKAEREGDDWIAAVGRKGDRARDEYYRKVVRARVASRRGEKASYPGSPSVPKAARATRVRGYTGLSDVWRDPAQLAVANPRRDALKRKLMR